MNFRRASGSRAACKKSRCVTSPGEQGPRRDPTSTNPLRAKLLKSQNSAPTCGAIFDAMRNRKILDSDAPAAVRRCRDTPLIQTISTTFTQKGQESVTLEQYEQYGTGLYPQERAAMHQQDSRTCADDKILHPPTSLPTLPPFACGCISRAFNKFTKSSVHKVFWTCNIMMSTANENTRQPGSPRL